MAARGVVVELAFDEVHAGVAGLEDGAAVAGVGEVVFEDAAAQDGARLGDGGTLTGVAGNGAAAARDERVRGNGHFVAAEVAIGKTSLGSDVDGDSPAARGDVVDEDARIECGF